MEPSGHGTALGMSEPRGEASQALGNEGVSNLAHLGVEEEYETLQHSTHKILIAQEM